MSEVMLGYCFAALVGALVGGLVVPKTSDLLLRRVRRRADAWWQESLEEYGVFKQRFPDREPVSSAFGAEGALGVWREDALACAASGLLTRERLDMLAKTGVKVEGLAVTGEEAQRWARHSFQATPLQRLLFAAALVLAYLLAVVLSPGSLSMLALCLCATVMLVAVVCDLRARAIPFEACLVLGGAGVIFQALVQGPQGVAAGVICAGLIVGGSTILNKLFHLRYPTGAVGQGDVRCMGALALTTGFGAMGGFMGCYLLAAISALMGCATKRLSWQDGIPMAPFMVLWLVIGVAASLGLL